MKRLDDLDATPEKKSYWAIVNDYDFNAALCELIDNPLDVALKSGSRFCVNVGITANLPNQSLKIDDDSGGVAREELALLVRPGASGGLETDNSIGIFGVGSKRSVVALAKNIKITTCRKNSNSHQVEYGDEWLASPSWDVPCFELAPSDEGHTIVKLTKLRHPLTQNKIDRLFRHLGETYGRFISKGRLKISLNKKFIDSILFEEWSHHPEYPPNEFTGTIETPDGPVKFSIIGGLLAESAYSTGEYGVFFYCNDRLIEKAARSSEVGFRKGEAGVPHHSHSAFRVIVSLNGPAKWMPWNSSKSRINYAHGTFEQIQGLICEVTKTYALLSKRLQSQWSDEIFPCKSGTVKKYKVAEISRVTNLPLPELPSVRPNYSSEISAINKNVVTEGRWRSKYIDSIVTLHSLQKQRSPFRNQMGVILAEGVFNLSLLDFIANEAKAQLDNCECSPARRNFLIDQVISRIDIPEETLKSIRRLGDIHFNLMNDPSIEISDAELEEIRTALQVIYWKMFNIKFPNRINQTYS
jgi:hypothetical protein